MAGAPYPEGQGVLTAPSIFVGKGPMLRRPGACCTSHIAASEAGSSIVAHVIRVMSCTHNAHTVCGAHVMSHTQYMPGPLNLGGNMAPLVHVIFLVERAFGDKGE